MKSIFKHFLLVFSLLSVQFSIAQTPTWKNITPTGWSGDFKQVFYGKGNGLIALADNGYFYLSKDTAHTWTIYPQPDTAIIAAVMYPDNTNGFLYNQVTAYKTADGAKTWAKLPLTGIPSDMQIRTIWIKNADTVFAVVTNLVNGVRIFLSSDKGNTWSQVAENIHNDATYITIYNFYFPTPLIGYGYGYDCYVTTTDGGKTWVDHPFVYDGYAKVYSKTYSYPDGRTILFFDNKLLLSSLGDADTTKTKQVGKTSDRVTDAIAFGADMYAIDESGNFYYSADSGSTWHSRVILNRAVWNNLTGMYFFNKLVGVAVSGLLTSMVTTDGGITWTKYVHGAADGFNKIYCKTKDECYITGNAGRLFHTIDGGTTWNYRDLNSGALQNVVFPTNDTGYVSASGVVFRTIDAGANWTKFKQGTGGGFIYFPTKDIGFIGYASGTPDIAKTTDAGQTWNTWLADMTFVNNIGYGGAGACFRSTEEGLVSGGSNNLLYTNDGGNSWQIKATGIVGNAIIPVNNDWLVINGSRVYLCDKDINCTLEYSDNNDGFLYGSMRNHNTIYLSAMRDSILISNNGGNTWHKEKDALFGRDYGFYFADSKTVYSLFYNTIYKGIFKVQTTSKFNQTNTQTLSCTITNDVDGSYYASILLINGSDTTIINKNILIDSGVPLSIKIPATIQVGSDYKIVVQPIDTIAYSSVVSQTFTLTELTTLEIEKPLVKVVGNRIVSDCTNLEIYNTLGQRMQNDAELPNGIYIVKCNNVTQKIIIKRLK